MNPNHSNYWPISELPGISPEQSLLLANHGIKSTQELLSKTKTLQSKHTLAAELKIHPQYVARWRALADLARVPSVGVTYCGLVLHAGVASMEQLGKTQAPRLHQNILRLQVANLQRRDLCPPVAVVQKWVSQAQVQCMMDEQGISRT